MKFFQFRCDNLAFGSREKSKSVWNGAEWISYLRRTNYATHVACHSAMCALAVFVVREDQFFRFFLFLISLGVILIRLWVVIPFHWMPKSTLVRRLYIHNGDLAEIFILTRYSFYFYTYTIDKDNDAFPLPVWNLS